MQESILALEAWEPSLNMTVHLGDICMKPLAPDNNFCADMTPFGYFQNNRTRLHQVKLDEFGSPQADYIDHFTACVKCAPIIDLITVLYSYSYFDALYFVTLLTLMHTVVCYCFKVVCYVCLK